eukprot:6200602-Pleurochrysis_carterae.AAC.1
MQVGRHWWGFTAIYADEGICGIFPRPDHIRSAAMFYVVPVVTIMEAMFCTGLCGTSRCRSWRPWFIWGSVPY